MQRLNSDIASRGPGWHLLRVEVSRKPLLGALIEVGARRQERYVESGGLVVGTPEGMQVYGPGHRVAIGANQTMLYLPVGSKATMVEWALVVAEQAEDLPSVDHSPPTSEPIALPLVEPVAEQGMYPDWARPWLRVPRDVATWASCLDVRSTSLTQRSSRLVGASAKKILSGIRATVAFELAAHYRGRGTELALDTGYSSHAHLSRDISKRFGVPLTTLLSDEVSRELDWLKLLKSVVR